MDPDAAADWVDEDPDEPEQEEFEVWPENWPTVRVFLAMQTQWRTTANLVGKIYEGLEYGSLREVWQGLGIRLKERAQIFQGLQTMELAAREILNERK